MTAKPHKSPAIPHWLSAVFLLVSLSGCMSGDNSIVHRWKLVDVRGTDHVSYKQEQTTKSLQYEFTKDGKFNMYMDGTLAFTSTYTLVDGGKTVRVDGPSGKDPKDFSVVSLHDGKLRLTIDALKRDTMIFEVK